MKIDTYEKWVQSRLTAHGFPVGDIDGVIGGTTRKAIRAFETAHGLRPDGQVDSVVEGALRASASVIPAAVKAEIPNRDRDDDPAIQAIALVDQRWPRQRDVPGFYGAVGTHQTSIEIPFDMALAWDKSSRVRKITLHQQVAPSALRVLERVAAIYSAADRHGLGLDLFGGSLNVRRMRGGTAYSMHSWGIAIDFDPERNALATHAPAARLSHPDAFPFWKAWEAEGWLSLGRARDYDWMHVQAARL